MSQPERGNRRAGVLLPVSSLPGRHEIGDLGIAARKFIDWMQEAGISEWSILPLNHTGFGDSPYQPVSAFAGNPNYISPDLLISEGILTEKEFQNCNYTENAACVDYGKNFKSWQGLLRKKVYPKFVGNKGHKREDYLNFCREQSYWLEDYAQFMAVKMKHGYKPWWEWPDFLANRREPEFSDYIAGCQDEIGFWKFIQYEFFRQWNDLREYAHEKGITIVGDMPFYVAPDSVDVWIKKELFAINPETNCITMWAGVPSDCFSESDRCWGCSVYRWDMHRDTGYEWFRVRIRVAGNMYDCLRIDHVIAIMRYYGIKSYDEKGQWYDGPDKSSHELSDLINKEAEIAGMSIIAEDLGRIPAGLRERMDELGWSGMRLLQYAFTGKYGSKSDHLPFFHKQQMVVYIGTHDNPTVKEFIDGKSDRELEYMMWWTGAQSREELPWKLICEAYKSPANRVFITVQDMLGLGKESRMVYSDEYEKSWKWKLSDLSVLDDKLAQRMKHLAVITGRFSQEEE